MLSGQAHDLASAAKLARPLSECHGSCSGNTTDMICGGTERMVTFTFVCHSPR
jgi:hypothetical protein